MYGSEKVKKYSSNTNDQFIYIVGYLEETFYNNYEPLAFLAFYITK